MLAVRPEAQLVSTTRSMPRCLALLFFKPAKRDPVVHLFSALLLLVVFFEGRAAEQLLRGSSASQHAEHVAMFLRVSPLTFQGGK